MSFHVILFQPEIPPNTGNVIRLCANTGCTLHLVHPLGFDLSAAQLRRAGMDYAEIATVLQHADWAACQAALAQQGVGRLFALTTKGNRRVTSADFQANDALLFGCETRGLPAALMAQIAPENRLRLPLIDAPNNRSLNLSNAVAVTVYEAWRQIGFPGAV